MKELIELILELTKDNIEISKFIDKNLELIKKSDLETMDNLTKDFYKFLNPFNDKNNRFKRLMKENNYKSVLDIKGSDEIDETDLSEIIKAFDISVKASQKKLLLYSKLIAGELNMINKIEHINKKNNLDLKF